MLYTYVGSRKNIYFLLSYNEHTNGVEIQANVVTGSIDLYVTVKKN